MKHDLTIPVHDWLLNCANDEMFSFDMADFKHDCDEILQGYAEDDDPVVKRDNRERLWKSLRGWQRDKEYISSLNLHRVIAKHVRTSCRACSCEDVSLETWVKRDSAGLVGLVDEIALAIRGAWKVRFPLKPGTEPKFSTELCFEKLDSFHLGLEELIGYPPTNLHFLELMKQEHEQGEHFPDRERRVVDPKVEWNVVMKGTCWTIPGAGCEPTIVIKKRVCEQGLHHYIKEANEIFSKAKASGTLIAAEVAALRLWTGPMHMKYAQVLRNPQKQSCPYLTTLHAINSGIMKLARIWPLPASRKVYRGYKNLRLEDFQKDAFNCVGGVEKCVLATSVDFNIAVDYSVNDSKVGAFILEIDVGQVNRGADVSWLSQFPHEKEILFNALSNVEFVSSPQQRFVEGRGTILVYQVCVSANVKGKTLEEFVRLRKDLHLNMYDEAQRMISLREEGSRYYLIKNLGAECRKQCDQMHGYAELADVEIFNRRTQAYMDLEEAAIMLPSRSLEIMDLALRWFETHRAAPAEVDRLQDWQLQALRTSFECSERPEVRTIVLREQEHQVESLFRARCLNFDTLDTMGRVGRLLSLNPELEALKIEHVSATAQLWEKFGADFGRCRPSLRVNGFRLATYAFRTLQQLELRSLCDDIAIMIAPALLIHPPNALTYLSLRGSPIACAGAECLGRAFTGMQRLRYVDLCSCQIARRGCNGISENLSALVELEELNLAHNQVDDDGFNVLAAAIRAVGLEQLKSVDMRDNNTTLPSLRCGPHCVMKAHLVSKFSTDALVKCVALSPGGDQIASASWDKTIIIWDAKTGEQISTLKGHTREVTSVAWRPGSPGHRGGDQIVSGGFGSGDAEYPWDNPGEIIIWDAKTGDQVAVLKGHTKGVTSVAWRPGENGRPGGDQIASGSRDGTIIIWDAKTGEQISTLKGHTSIVNCVAWRPERPGHPGGDQIASGSNDNTIIIWDAKTCEQVSTLKGHSGSVYSVAWRPGGDQIVSGGYGGDSAYDPGEIIIWDANTGEQVSSLKGHTRAVTSVAWRPGGDQIVSGAWAPFSPGEVIIWDATTGNMISELKGHTKGVNSVAWRPGGDQIASGSDDGTIIIWDAKTGEQVSTLKGHTNLVNSVAWRPERPGHPGGDQICSSSYQTIINWDTATGEQVSTLKGHTESVKSVSWNSGGAQMASESASDDTKVMIRGTRTGDQVSMLEGQITAGNSMAFPHGCDRVISVTVDNDIITRDAKTGDQVSTLKGHTDHVRSISWNPGRSRIASGSDDESIIIWDVETGETVRTLRGHTNKVTSVAWSPTADHIVSGSSDTTLIIWDATTGDQVLTLKGHSDEVQSVSWSPDGDRIASGSADSTIMIWEAKSGNLVSILQGRSGKINNIVWSPSGMQLASVFDDQTVMVWDVMMNTGALASQLEGHADMVESGAWSAVSGEQVISCSRDMWDTATGDQGVRLAGNTGAIHACGEEQAAAISDGCMLPPAKRQKAKADSLAGTGWAGD